MIAADLQAVMDIEKRGYRFHWSTLNFTDCLAADYENMVLLRADHIVGYGVMTVDVNECHILNLCIDPNFQRQGYGDALLQTILARAIVLGAEYVILEVRRSNTAAICMYHAAGFGQIGQRRGYYPDHEGREDALVFMRLLTSTPQTDD